MKVPLKLGWGYDLVRVCNRCRDELMKNENGNNNDSGSYEIQNFPFPFSACFWLVFLYFKLFS